MARTSESSRTSTTRTPVSRSLARVSSGLISKRRVLVPLADSSVSREFLRVSYRKEQIDAADTGDVGDVIDAGTAATVGQSYGVSLPDSSYGYESAAQIEARRAEAAAAQQRADALEAQAARLDDDAASERAGATAAERAAAEAEQRRDGSAPGCRGCTRPGRVGGGAHEASLRALKREVLAGDLRGSPCAWGTPAFDDREHGVGDLSLAPFVRVETGLGQPRRPVTAVFLHGEHDFGSRAIAGDALELIHSDLLVDLSWCTFVDSSLIAMMLAKHAALEREGHELVVILPPTHTHLSRTFDRLGARQLLPVRDAPPFYK